MTAPTTWRPLGWHNGKRDPFAPEEGHTPENTEKSYSDFKSRGYYTAGGKLTSKGQSAKDAQTAADVSANRAALRDSWNTHPVVWRLGAAVTGVEFRVDPFHNQGAQALPALERTLTGHSPDVDGLLTVAAARLRLADPGCTWDAKTRATIERYLDKLGDVDDKFPALWRGDLPKGKAAAACNGPHSITEQWLTCADAYGSEEITACFVPDNGDGWFQSLGMSADIIVHLGRVPCLPPPGIKASSPRGASALLIRLPPTLDRSTLPKATQRVLDGQVLKVPLWKRKIKGVQYGYVSAGAVAHEHDFGLLDGGE